MNAQTERHQAIIRRAMRAARGDDLERANLAFGQRTDAELERHYGQSGKTCREIWDELKEHRANHDAAMEYLEDAFIRADER